MSILDEFDRLPRWGEPDHKLLRERFLEKHRDVLRRALRRDYAIESPTPELLERMARNGHEIWARAHDLEHDYEKVYPRVKEIGLTIARSMFSALREIVR